MENRPVGLSIGMYRMGALRGNSIPIPASAVPDDYTGKRYIKAIRFDGDNRNNELKESCENE